MPGHDVISSLAGGVVSSILAVTLIEGYLRIRRRYHERSLSRVLGFYDAPCSIITPAHAYEGELYQVIGVRDVFAVSFALAACMRVGSTAALASSHQLAEGIVAPNMISIGGWSGNKITESLMAIYCPGFVICNKEKHDTDFDSIYYECGARVFKDTDDVMYSFLVKLSPRMTGLDGSCLLVWGHQGPATVSGVYFVSEFHRVLSRLKKDSFFVVLTVSRSLGSRAVSRLVLDISDDAFAAPGSGS